MFSLSLSAHTQALLGLALSLLLAGCGGGTAEPTLELTVRIDGVVATAMPVRQGEQVSIDVPTGGRVELMASEPVDWSSSLGGATVTSATQTEVLSRFVLSHAGIARTSSVFEARARSAPTRSLSVTLNIAAAAFAQRARTVGEFSRWQTTFTPAGGPARSDGYREAVTQIAPGGVALVVTTRASDGRTTAYREFDDQGHTVSFAQVSYDDAGNDYPSTCDFDPPVADLSYPLALGKTWNLPWSTTHCVDTTEGSGNLAAEVEGYETVNVPAGTFDALRIRTRQTPDLPFAGGFARSESVCWWSVELRRHVKCETTLLDFTTGQPTGMLEDLLIEIGGLGPL